jgi:mono/diheme cytochrome c family protein
MNVWRLCVLVLIAAFWIALPARVSTQSSQAAKATDKETIARGEAWFYQRCSLCHLGRIVKDEKFKPMGPSLSGLFKDASPTREVDVREMIQTGTLSLSKPLRMPGFRYGLDSKQLDELIAYLKTL